MQPDLGAAVLLAGVLIYLTIPRHGAIVLGTAAIAVPTPYPHALARLRIGAGISLLAPATLFFVARFRAKE